MRIKFCAINYPFLDFTQLSENFQTHKCINIVADIPGSIYKDRKVVVTGHTGFKGSWLAAWLSSLGADVLGVALPPDQDPAHINLLGLDISQQYLDIREADAVKNLFREFQPEIVFHLAAQPLVRKSYLDPLETYQTNVIGTLSVYEACRSAESVKAIVSITTDKVYENREWEWGYRETDSLGGYDPYSSSKACAEILSCSYRRSFLDDMNDNPTLLATVRAGNVVGGGDWSLDRLIPDAMKAAADGQAFHIRNPYSIRPWQHVLDPVYAYLLIGSELLKGNAKVAAAWNIGPVFEKDWSVSDVMEFCSSIWPRIRWTTESNSSGKPLHEAGTLKLDCSKALRHLDWKPVWDTRTALQKTVTWYSSYYQNDKVNTYDDIASFMENLNPSSDVTLKIISNW
jgi:CDP-glucose 4,6-dehydratase